MGLSPGTKLGAYEILAPLGAGGMGEVYRARDAKLRREVAIKVLPAAVATDPDRLARFEREAHAVAALSHPNVLAIYDFGTDGGVTYAVMELLAGQTLRDAMRGGRLPRRKAVDYAMQMVKGLDAAHARGLVHRDLKPENVVVSTTGHVKILDFGLAVQRTSPEAGATQTAEGATHPGAVLGTPGYMSPEQVRGEIADHRSDVFSFGCVLYEMLSGHRAFQGESSVDALHATLRSDPPDLSTLAVPDGLARIVSRCLEKSPAERFQSARDLGFALEAVAETRESHVPAPRRSTPRALLRRAELVATLAVIAIIGAAWLVTSRRERPQDPAAPANVVTAQPRGIAVLPFENLGSAEQAYFAAGVTEEVTLQLSKISALRVMSRNAVSRFKGGAAELPAMTKELGIGAILTGTVRHAGDQVRVGVQLLAAPSGETMWSEQYNGSLTRIFDMQTSVAVSVARSLQASLAPEERARIERPPTENAQAYELYLQQRPLRLPIQKENQEGIDLLEHAVALDPRFALAYATMSRRYQFLGYITGRDHHTRAVDLARTAVSLDQQLPRAHHALAIGLTALGQMEDARLAMQRAIELDPNFYTAIEDLSLLEVNAGRLDQAVYWAKRGLPLAPNVASSHYHLGIPLIILDDGAAERFLLAAEKRFALTDPTGGQRIRILLAIIDLRRGRDDAALTRLRAAVAAQPEIAEGQTVLTEMTVFTGAPDARERVDTALADGPGARSWHTPYTPRTFRAFLWSESGDPGRARPLIEAALAANRNAMDTGDRSFGPLYENGALHVMRNDRAAALDSLDAAARAGWTDVAMWKRDRLIAPLAGEPRFAEIVERVERAVREMRQRIDLRELDDWAMRQ